MIHYHGADINPDTCAVRAWKSRHALVSFVRSAQLGLASEITQSFCLDNGAYSAWSSGKTIDWQDYYRWVDEWRMHPRFDFAIVPDVITGSEQENDTLAAEWPFPRHQSAVVWHTNESVERLVRLAAEWPRVALGSSKEFDAAMPAKLIARLRAVLPAICNEQGYPKVKLHGLRMLNPRVFEHIPLSSADSTNAGRNAGIDKKWKGTYLPVTKEARVDILVGRIESTVSASRLFDPEVMALL